MAKRGKKYLKARELKDKPEYTLEEAVARLKQGHYAKFDESVDLAMRLGVNPKQSDQMVRGTVVLPHGTGKTKKICVLAAGEKIKEAEAAGADLRRRRGADREDRRRLDRLRHRHRHARHHARAWASSAGSWGPRASCPIPSRARSPSTSRRPSRRPRPARWSSASTRRASSTSTVGKVSFPEAKLVENVKTLPRGRRPRQAGLGQGQVRPDACSSSSTMGPSFKIAEDILEK